MTRVRKRKAHRTEVIAYATNGVREFVSNHPWWQTTVFVIGMVALITAVSVLFLGAGVAPAAVSTNQPVAPVDSAGFATALSHLVNAPIEQGGTIEVLNNGDGFLPVLLRDIQNATTTINFLVYMWEDGAFSDQVLDVLLRRQREGVAVRVLLDGLGARRAPDERFEELEKAGGRVERFRTPKFGTWTRFHRRNHRRSIVIDGRTGFTGGMAIFDKWLGNAEAPGHWRDMMFRVTGPLARSLQAAFVDSWASSSGEILVGPGIYPPGAKAAPGGVATFIHHVNSPADDDLSMAYFLLLPILAARERVYLVTPYFIPDESLKDALRKKAAAGVDVRLLLPGEHIDNQSARLSGQNHYDELMQSGVKIYEYKPTFIHSKFVVVDGLWSVIGSPNLNSRSRQLDEENAFGILDATLAKQLEEIFLADVKKSDEITLETWRERNVFLRIVQLFARVLDQQS
jgi:cardiolipin synthase